MIKRSVAALMCAVLMITCLSACSKGEKTTPGREIIQNGARTEAVSVDTSSFRLSYSQSDSLNPFESETLNNQVVENLVFDSLFYIDESYTAVPQIAESYSYPEEGQLVITIKKGLFFSDSTPIASENIIYSFNRAKESPRWENTLSAFTDAEAESADTVVFYLKKPNPNAHCLLTFAIARKDPDEQGNPIGSGRYRFVKGEGGIYLLKNELHAGFEPHFARINLVNIASGESVENAINIGNISYAFRDLSSGSNIKITSGSRTVILSNLVYLGINCTEGVTQNKNIRKAINLAINRNTIVKSAYRGYGKPAKSVFTPASSIGRQSEIFSDESDSSAARQTLSAAGYENGKLNLTLVTTKSEGKKAAAQLIKQQLESAGFNIKVTVCKDDEYFEKIRYGNYDLYIGETKIPSDLGLGCFFSPEGAAHYGINTETSKSAASYNGYLKGENEIGSFFLDFSEELPFLPLLYREGMICYSKSLRGDIQGYEGNYFSNIEDWYYN